MIISDAMDVRFDTDCHWIMCTICEELVYGLYRIRSQPTYTHTAKPLLARVCTLCYEKMKMIPDHIPIEQHCIYVKVLIKRLQRERWMKPSSSKVEQSPVKGKVTRSSRV